MEPAAPGTEDLPLSFPAISKQESEQERLLSLRAVLPNGRYGNVFERSYTGGVEHWYCNMCECPIMGRVYHHEIGKRHTSNLSSRDEDGGGGKHQAGGAQQQPQEPIVTVQVAPGEPVPPGFEGEVEKVCEIQERLDNYTVGPLVGLEYLLEIQEYDPGKEPTYICLLCDKKGDPRTVIAHLASYNHVTQFLQKHFPTVHRILTPYATRQYKRNWQTTVQKIVEAIEHRYGRLKPHSVEQENFDEKRLQILLQVNKGPHISESNGVTFEELIDKDELTKSLDEPSANQVSINKPPEDRSNYRKSNADAASSSSTTAKKRSPSPPVVTKPSKKTKADSPKKAKTDSSTAPKERRRSLSSISTISSSELSDFEPEKKPVKNKSPSRRRRSPSPRSPRSRSRRHSRSRSRDRDSRLPPWQRSDYRRPRSDVAVDSRSRNNDKSKTGDKWAEYKKLATAIENDMSRQLKQHEKNPEKHPKYNDEWKLFWNKRYKELQSEGKDPSKHDFKPEWIVFWNKRMLELHNAEVKSKKDALKRRLGLPEEPAPISFKIATKKDDRRTADKMVDNEVIVIDDKDDSRSDSKRSHSPWEGESASTRKPSRDRSRDRDRRISEVRNRDRDARRSRERDTRRSRERDARRSRERDARRSREPRSKDRDLRSRDRDLRSRDRDLRSRDRDLRSRDRDARSRDRDIRSRDRDELYVREASYNRELNYYRRERDILEAYKPPRVMRDVTREPVRSPPRYRPPPMDDDDDTTDINVVGVLRLLTALEEKLGSLGPKVIDLLAQALAMEKNEANSSELILDNEVNCVLFETVKEKLKGQMLAGLVEYAQEKAYKNAIKKIASLVHYAGERRKARDKKHVDPVKVAGIGTVDKAAIAKQIATALVMQGKTDVTQAELEQLINAVVGMAEASKNSDKPMTTASFLQKLTSEKPSSTETRPMTDALHALQGSSAPSEPNSMEGLSDSDLQTLLQNFKDLSTTEQHDLITYLKKLEAKEPERVERLRKFVTLGQDAEKVGGMKERRENNRESSPFSGRFNEGNPMVEEEKPAVAVKAEEKDVKEEKVAVDSDEEEYSFEDVFKAAKKNVNEKEAEQERLKKEKKSAELADAKAIIASLMGTVVKKTATPQPTTTAAPISLPASTFSNVPISIDNLTNIVGNIKNLVDTTAVAVATKPLLATKPAPAPQPRIPPPIKPLMQQTVPAPCVQYPIGQQQQQQPRLGGNYPGYPAPRPNVVQYPTRASYPGGYGQRPPMYNNGSGGNRQGSYGNPW